MINLRKDSNEKTLEPSLWVKSFGDYLFSYALFKVGNRETAEDLVQETFVSAIHGRDAFKGDSSEKTWLVSILKNKIIDFYRKKDVLKSASEYVVETEDDFSSQYFDKSNGHWLKNTTPQEWHEPADGPLTMPNFRTYFNCVFTKCLIN